MENGNDELRKVFLKLVKEYSDKYDYAWKNNDFSNSFKEIITDDIPSLLIKCVVDSSKYKVEGRYGTGRWSATPWIAIMNPKITSKASKGVYIVYLLNKDKKELFLSFATAATEAERKSRGDSTVSSKKISREAKEILLNNVAEVKEKIKDNYFCDDGNIKTGSEAYDLGTIYYKKYVLDTFPTGDELVDDLSRMLKIYDKYYEIEYLNNSPSYEASPEPKENISIEDDLKEIENHIRNKGFAYSDEVIKNFYLCLKSKPFVILAGTSGTGKTRLVRLFAEAIGAKEDGRYLQIPVKPDWSDSSDLLGYTNLNGEFIPGKILEFIEKASKDLKQPYILCLDEMNIARVEYYFSDFLSIIETRDKEGDVIITDPFFTKGYFDKCKNVNDAKKYEGIGLPENLYVVGTVNMDETTFPFSKKVLDRANTIEFNHVDLIPSFAESGTVEEPQKLDNSFLKSDYLQLSECEDEYKEFIKNKCKELEEMNTILRKANEHVGYRVRDEIMFYLLNNKKANDLIKGEDENKDTAFDLEILQKILPRIQGNTQSIKELLHELFVLFVPGYVYTDGDREYITMQKALSGECKYRRSAEKIAMMMKRFEEDGFTSYWL